MQVPRVTRMRHSSNNLRGSILPLRVEQRIRVIFFFFFLLFSPHIILFFPLSLSFPPSHLDSIAHLEFTKKQGSDKFQPRYRGSPTRDSERFRIIASRRMQMKTARSILNIRDLSVYPRDSKCFFYSSPLRNERNIYIYRERDEALEIFSTQFVAFASQSVLFA